MAIFKISFIAYKYCPETVEVESRDQTKVFIPRKPSPTIFPTDIIIYSQRLTVEVGPFNTKLGITGVNERFIELF